MKKQESVITSQQVQIQNTQEMLRFNGGEKQFIPDIGEDSLILIFQMVSEMKCFSQIL